MASAVARKGYEAVTIADVVAEAGVSKRTFYEHFASKKACLLACYGETVAAMMAAIRLRLAAPPGERRALDPPVPSLIGSVLETYLAFLDQAPQFASTLLIEIQRIGDEGRRTYRQSNLEFARLIRDSAAATGESRPRAFDLEQSIALVGGVNELLLTHAEDKPDVSFRSLAPAVQRFVEAVIGPLPVPSA
jgi:AcrR family transcriptional regulator